MIISSKWTSLILIIMCFLMQLIMLQKGKALMSVPLIGLRFLTTVIFFQVHSVISVDDGT